MSDYNEYMRAYRAKNRDRINARQRERRKSLSNKSIASEVIDTSEGIIGTVKRQIAYIGAKMEAEEEKEFIKAVSTPEEDRKCCTCHLPGKHYKRNRWFCDAHMP